MAPSRLVEDEDAVVWNSFTNNDSSSEECFILHRNVKKLPLKLVDGGCFGNYITLENGWEIFDAATGAAVVCLGYQHPRLIEALTRQSNKIIYYSSTICRSEIGDAFGQALIATTNRLMALACFYNSGSEAVEAAVKCAWQYFRELPRPEMKRTQFISRWESYHGATLGALSLSGHRGRRKMYGGLLGDNFHHISPCNPYHRPNGVTIEEYRDSLLLELDAKFEELGPGNVVAFIAEPVVGAALGSVESVPGLLKGYREICNKYGALLIFDEVMCGMGRCGTMHAWQRDGVVPDLQTVGKGLGGGFPISGMLLSHKVAKAFANGTGEFSHGHTHQGNPLGCAMGLEILKVVQEENLLDNINKMGNLLIQGLHDRLDYHANVGNIRGRGLFCGIEFVQDKATKQPFDPRLEVSANLAEKALTPGYHIRLYPGTGTKDGKSGDHILIAPAYNITETDVDIIVDRTARAIEDFFDELEAPKLQL